MFDGVVAVLFTCVLMALLHYLPWRGLFRRDLPVLARYVLGVLALVGPLSVLWVVQEDWSNLVLVWSVVVCGGLTVILLHVLDASIEARGRADIAEEEGRQLRGQANKRS
ncbi:MAG: hypothetical protein ACOX5F_00935 [Anaerovoracaceae bacterium]|jgi:hypothetical protein